MIHPPRKTILTMKIMSAAMKVVIASAWVLLTALIAPSVAVFVVAAVLASAEVREEEQVGWILNGRGLDDYSKVTTALNLLTPDLLVQER